MKLHVMQCVVSLAPGGAESLALTILEKAGVRGSVCGLVRGTGALIPAIEAQGLPWHVLSSSSPRRFPVWKALAGVLRRERVDVAHVQAGYLLSFVLPAALLAGVRVVYTEHAKHSLEQQPMLRRVVRLCAPFVHAVTCVSENLKSFMVERVGIDTRRIQVIPNGVDLGRFTQAAPSPETRGLLPESWGGPDITVFGNVARFSEAKDHPGLLRAFDEVRRRHPGVRLLLVGDGETRPGVESLISELGLGEFVQLAGMRRDVPALLGLMDVFVLSSMREGMPISVLEAMAAGLPVLTTDVGGIGEVVQDGVTARVVAPREVTALAGGLAWMVENAAARADMAARGKALIHGQYGHERMVERYAELYADAGRRP
ncbi:Glycosyltransferase involved in cell wall bisynthesis [Desulfomicrobium norvegicum]|uniref:Glycosyltransferase involved in cell wall bisynthesis n=1 Tax=Desulfomicrobium norvegicum (strain DSM 1741 / NCIMB 8310) TaxID=52561 RepID=A0A8G2BZT9_DESNO|nr:glycosyltransferase [Desulfomicrobium norvegicum]SFL28274.1 Glycosyltransferase involved in cell wall bisynthesis [Desulfomicrobium norvegicum]